ncbi:hypothetical protein Tco_0519341 [Tanacetum coccineum]
MRLLARCILDVVWNCWLSVDGTMRYEWAPTAGITTLLNRFYGERELELEMSDFTNLDMLSMMLEHIRRAFVKSSTPAAEFKSLDSLHLGLYICSKLVKLRRIRTTIASRIPRWEPGAILP